MHVKTSSSGECLKKWYLSSNAHEMAIVPHARLSMTPWQKLRNAAWKYSIALGLVKGRLPGAPKKIMKISPSRHLFFRSLWFYGAEEAYVSKRHERLHAGKDEKGVSKMG